MTESVPQQQLASHCGDKNARAISAAEGTTYYDTCTPDCASGFGHTRGRVTLSAVHRCGHQLRYLRLRFVYFGAPEHNLHVGFNCKGVAKHVHIGR